MRSSEEFPLTEADKESVLFVSRILWADEEIIGLRGIKIGDPLDGVKAKFLDKSSEYGNKPIIYSPEDFPELDIMDAPFASSIDHGAAGAGTYLDGMNVDFQLLYAMGSVGEGASFFFKDGILVGMSQDIRAE